jgi:small subunit ribosomal protein S2
MSDGFLIKQEKYLESGIHIGTKLKTIDMQKFIFKRRSDGLYILDLKSIDERIKIAAKIISKYDPSKVYVIASRTYSSIAANVFSRLTSINVLSGRFIPGRFTNVGRKDFLEPELVIICDPKGEKQAVSECGKMGIPTIGLCDTDNYTAYIDWIVPCNNKGRKSLSLIFWLLARELAMSSNKISSYDEFKPDFEEFEKLTNEFLDQQKDQKELENQKVEEILEENENSTNKQNSINDNIENNKINTVLNPNDNEKPKKRTRKPKSTKKEK